MTEFSADYPTVHVDVSDGDGYTSVRRLFAFMCYTESTSQGIANFFGALTPDDEANYRIAVGVVNLHLDNVLTAPVLIGDGRLYRDDGTLVIAATSGSIQMEPDKAYVAGLGLVSTQVAELYRLAGLQAGAPMTVTPTSRTVGSITLAISGDGTTSTTVTRT